MRKKSACLFIAFATLFIGTKAQVTDNFSDGDYTANPAWSATAGDWIINGNGQLQSNNTAANSTFFITTPNALATETQWDFFVKLTFNTSSANYVDVFLTASANDLSAATTNGYFVRIGSTQDDICLYKKAGATSTKIIDGLDGTTNTSNNSVKIRVTRNAANQWVLYRDLSGTGSTFTIEGTATDNTYNTSAFLGILIKQSTVASFAQRHFFDDITVQPYVPDLIPPAIVSAAVITSNTLDVLFSEPVGSSSETISNYVADNGLGSPVTAVLDATNRALVHLTFGSSFTNVTAYTLSINNVADIAGNAISNGTINFSFTATPPVIQSAVALSLTAVDVLFNETLDVSSAQNTGNYVAGGTLGSPTAAVLDASNRALVHLTFAGGFSSGVVYQLVINGVKDLQGSPMVNGNVNFSFYIPAQYDVVIDEIMADPTPQVALPNNEWIELRNTTRFAINLQGWRIKDPNGTSGPLPSLVLQPDSFLIVCTGSAVPALAAFGRTASVTSFPSLDNTGEAISLQDADGNLIHSVNYNVSWFNNELKKDGGWTLEMIDTKNPCSGSSNWAASNDLSGGTPGRKNSADAANQDNTAPKLVRAYATDSLNVVLVFSEPVSNGSASVSTAYTISDGIGAPSAAAATTPLFDRVALTLSTPLVRGKIYTIMATGVTDCVGNALGNSNKARVGLSEITDSLDVVVNEILFNPPSNGYDYVEIYNRSKKIINLSQTYIANRNTTGTIGSITQLSAEPYLFFPEDFMVLTPGIEWVKANYITLNPDAFISLDLPSFTDTDGDVILLNGQGNITDELVYTDKWHFKLLDNKEGVALERIDYNGKTQSPDNWHSAATSAGYGTPTYKNSQFRMNDGVQGTVAVLPEIISPDNDGQDDFATIEYRFPEAGYVTSITIFDANGRPVRYLQRNALSGTTGNYRWDGLGEKNQQLGTGIYIVLTEVFNLAGRKKQFKKTIVVARRN